MTALRTLAFTAFAALVIAGVTGPAGSSATGTGSCGLSVEIRDPGLRASFAKFDASQSAGAAKVCAVYRNAELSH